MVIADIAKCVSINKISATRHVPRLIHSLNLVSGWKRKQHSASHCIRRWSGEHVEWCAILTGNTRHAYGGACRSHNRRLRVLWARYRIESGIAAIVTGRTRRAVAVGCGASGNQHSSEWTHGRILHSSTVTKTALGAHSSCDRVERTKDHYSTENNDLFSAGRCYPMFGNLVFVLRLQNSQTCQKLDQKLRQTWLKNKRKQKK